MVECGVCEDLAARVGGGGEPLGADTGCRGAVLCMAMRAGSAALRRCWERCAELQTGQTTSPAFFFFLSTVAGREKAPKHTRLKLSEAVVLLPFCS